VAINHSTKENFVGDATMEKLICSLLSLAERNWKNAIKDSLKIK
jgi:hypothetical protein